MKRRNSAIVALLLVVAVACAEADDDGVGGAGDLDAAAVVDANEAEDLDSGGHQHPDSGELDSSEPDTSEPDMDSSAPDTSVPDSSVPDSSTSDTSVPDTSVPDTSVPDTSTPDTSTPDTSPAAVVINEFLFNEVGVDSHEYVEVLGPATTDLGAYSLVVVEGDGSGAGLIDKVIAVGTTDGSGLWWSGYQPNDLQNGTQTLLLVRDFAGAEGDDLDTNNDGTLDATPWSAIADGVAVTDGGAGDLTFAGVTVLDKAFDAGTISVGGASRVPDGADTDTVADWRRNDYDLAGLMDASGAPIAGTPVAPEAYNTPGATNVAVP